MSTEKQTPEMAQAETMESTTLYVAAIMSLLTGAKTALLKLYATSSTNGTSANPRRALEEIAAAMEGGALPLKPLLVDFDLTGWLSDAKELIKLNN